MDALVPASIPRSRLDGTPHPGYAIYLYMIEVLENDWPWNIENLCNYARERGVLEFDRGQAKSDALKALQNMLRSSLPPLMLMRASLLLATMNAQTLQNRQRHKGDHELAKARKDALDLAAKKAGNHVLFAGQVNGPVAIASDGVVIHQTFDKAPEDEEEKRQDNERPRIARNAAVIPIAQTLGNMFTPTDLSQSTARDSEGNTGAKTGRASVLSSAEQAASEQAQKEDQPDTGSLAHAPASNTPGSLDTAFPHRVVNPLFRHQPIRLPRTNQHTQELTDEEDDEEGYPMASPITPSSSKKLKRRLTAKGLVMLALDAGYSVVKEDDGSLILSNKKSRTAHEKVGPYADSINFTSWHRADAFAEDTDSPVSTDVPTQSNSPPIASQPLSDRPGIGKFKVSQGRETVSFPPPLREALQELDLNETGPKSTAVSGAPPSTAIESMPALQASQMKPADKENTSESASAHEGNNQQGDTVSMNPEERNQGGQSAPHAQEEEAWHPEAQLKETIESAFNEQSNSGDPEAVHIRNRSTAVLSINDKAKDLGGLDPNGTSKEDAATSTVEGQWKADEAHARIEIQAIYNAKQNRSASERTAFDAAPKSSSDDSVQDKDISASSTRSDGTHSAIDPAVRKSLKVPPSAEATKKGAFDCEPPSNQAVKKDQQAGNEPTGWPQTIASQRHQGKSDFGREKRSTSSETKKPAAFASCLKPPKGRRSVKGSDQGHRMQAATRAPGTIATRSVDASARKVKEASSSKPGSANPEVEELLGMPSVSQEDWEKALGIESPTQPAGGTHQVKLQDGEA